MFLKAGGGGGGGGGSSIIPFKVGGALVDLVHVANAVINRIVLQGSQRYCRRGHNTIVLHPSHSK